MIQVIGNASNEKSLTLARRNRNEEIGLLCLLIISVVICCEVKYVGTDFSAPTLYLINL